MSNHKSGDSTCWTVIRAAATGDQSARELFARFYEPVVRTYLTARWRGGALIGQLEDAAQEVFLALLKPAGALDNLDSSFQGGFRPFLYGVVRNIARRFEARSTGAEGTVELDQLPGDDPSLSRVFDRAWATAIMRSAAAKQAELAVQADAQRRVELLRMRFQYGLPIREIARQWNEPAEQLHREYAKARAEFREALIQVVAFHQPGPPEAIEQVAAELLTALG